MRTRYKLSISRWESKCHRCGDRYARLLRLSKYDKPLIFLRCYSQRFNAVAVSSHLYCRNYCFSYICKHLFYARFIHQKICRFKKVTPHTLHFGGSLPIFLPLHAVIALIYQHCRELRSPLLSLPFWLVR